MDTCNVKCREAPTCKAIVQEGPRNGFACEFTPSENGYCNRHQRNKIYDDGMNNGTVWCRFFFRGCNNTLTKDELETRQKSCKACRDKLNKKKFDCKHTGCKNKVLEQGFCIKHQRDLYRIEEKEKGIQYCDIARGCFKICLDGKQSCEECAQKRRVRENNIYAHKKDIFDIVKNTTVSKRVCRYCTKEFEAYMTRYNKESVSCVDCNNIQIKQDVKRGGRERNYRLEKFRNLKPYFKEYIKSARNKGRIIEIDFDQFSSFVNSPCYYCGYFKEGEVNGIDRIDNSRGYEYTNCVSACSTCNSMKYIYHPDFFIDKCKIISRVKSTSSVFFEKWNIYYNNMNYKNFKFYKQGALKRELSFDLTEEQWNTITRYSCYICDYRNEKGIGIDRYNNSIRAYTIENSRPCCGSCNNMKGSFEYDMLVKHCRKVAEKWPNEVNFSHIPYKGSENTKINTKHTPKERKIWKAAGLYYAILSEKANDFYNVFSNVCVIDEYNTLCQSIKEMTKVDAISKLRTFIQTLNKRKKRLIKSEVLEAPTPLLNSSLQSLV